MENKRAPGSSNPNAASARNSSTSLANAATRSGPAYRSLAATNLDLRLDCERRCTFGGLLACICPSARESPRMAGTTRACGAPTAGNNAGHDLSNDARDLRREHVACVQRWHEVHQQIEQDEQAPVRAEAVRVAHGACSRPAGRVHRPR